MKTDGEKTNHDTDHHGAGQDVESQDNLPKTSEIPGGTFAAEEIDKLFDLSEDHMVPTDAETQAEDSGNGHFVE